MSSTPMFCAEQIQVPPVLPDVLREYAKEVIRNNPSDVVEFSIRYFEQLANLSDGSKVGARNLSEEDVVAMRRLFDKYDQDGNGVMDTAELGTFIRVDLDFDISEEELQAVMRTLDADNSGKLEFEELLEWWATISPN